MKRQVTILAALLALTAGLYLGAYFLPAELNLWRLWPVRVVTSRGYAAPQISGLFFHLLALLAYAMTAAWLSVSLLRVGASRAVPVGIWILAGSLIFFLGINLELTLVSLPAAMADSLRGVINDHPSTMSFYTQGGLRRFFLGIVAAHTALTYCITWLVGRVGPTRSSLPASA